MRLFVALAMTGEVQEALEALLAQWKSAGWPVAWVRPEGLHLTLKFLGEVTEERFPSLVTAVAGAVRGTPPLTLTLSEPGAFPAPSRARVLWAGLETEGALEILVHRVEQACAGLGFALEGRPYRPHVTLGRVRERERLPVDAVEAIDTTALSPVSCLAREVGLYQSQSSPGGSRYTVRATFPLESAS